MSSDEVRLFLNWRGDFVRSRAGECSWDPFHEYVAVRAAKHAALMRVVEEAAIAVLRLEDARRNPLLAKAVSDYRALNATAPERQGEAPRA